MSLSLVTFNKEWMFLSSDSRESIEIEEGKRLKLNDNVIKSIVLDNDIIFFSGLTELCHKVIETYMQINNRTVEELQKIINEKSKLFKNGNNNW